MDPWYRVSDVERSPEYQRECNREREMWEPTEDQINILYLRSLVATDESMNLLASSKIRDHVTRNSHDMAYFMARFKSNAYEEYCKCIVDFRTLSNCGKDKEDDRISWDRIRNIDKHIWGTNESAQQ